MLEVLVNMKCLCFAFSSLIIGFGVFTEQVDEAVENWPKWKSCLSQTKIQGQTDTGVQITGYIFILIREWQLVNFLVILPVSFQKYEYDIWICENCQL